MKAFFTFLYFTNLENLKETNEFLDAYNLPKVRQDEFND